MVLVVVLIAAAGGRLAFVFRFIAGAGKRCEVGLLDGDGQKSGNHDGKRGAASATGQGPFLPCRIFLEALATVHHCRDETLAG